MAENGGKEEGARPPRGSALEQSSLKRPNVTQGNRVENKERSKAPCVSGPPATTHLGRAHQP